VAVSVAAGVAALTSAVPELLPYTVELAIGVLVLVTLVNLRGIAHSARAFVAPTVVFVVAVLTVIVAGLVRGAPAVDVAHTTSAAESVGALLLLKAFANGCASLTGVEAIANAVPAFREPRVRRAQQAEVALGAVLAVMLLGIALLIEKFSVAPADGVTVLAQVTRASVGDGWVFYVVQLSTVVLLALAANTSYGGLPVLARLLARDNFLPHVFALESDRHVHRYGIGFLAVTAGALLLVSRGQVNVLVPVFAIGVFVGFTLSQVGMVRHWLGERDAGWQGRVALNGLGAVLTGAAAVVVTATKFIEGGWLVVVTLPLLVLAMEWVHRSYARIGASLGIGLTPARPRRTQALVVVPVQSVTELTRVAICAALSLGDRVVAVNVTHPGDEEAALRLREQWLDWAPDVDLVQCYDAHRRIDVPILRFLDEAPEGQTVLLVAEVEPEHAWQRFLQNQRGGLLARAVRRQGTAVVCRMRFRLEAPAEAGVLERATRSER